MTQRGLTELTTEQLISAFDNLGSEASDFKTDVLAVLVDRMVEAHPQGFAACPNVVAVPPPEIISEHLTWLRVYERVKDCQDYQRRIADGWDAVMNRS